MEATLQKRHKSIIIILSLLVHLGFLIPLLVFRDTELDAPTFMLFPTAQEDLTEEERTQKEELIEYILSSGMMPNQTKEEFQTDMATAQPAFAQATAQQAEPIDQPEEAQEDQEEEPQTAIDTQTVTERELMASPTPLEEPAPEQMTVVEPAYAEATARQAEPTPKKRVVQRKKQQLSLSKITQGFMRSVQQEEGINNPPAMDAERLAAHQYATKLWNIIKNSFRGENSALHLAHAIDILAYLVITIAKNGQLIDIHLEANQITSEFKQIEALLVSRAQKAGLFPPLPQRFGVPQKTFTFPIRLQGQAGYHAYHLSYGPNH